MKALKTIVLTLFAASFLIAWSSPTNKAKLLVPKEEIQQVKTVFIPQFDGNSNYATDGAKWFAEEMNRFFEKNEVTDIKVIVGEPRDIDEQVKVIAVLKGKAYTDEKNTFFQGHAVTELERLEDYVTLAKIRRPSKSKRHDSKREAIISAIKITARDVARVLMGKDVD